MSDKQLYRAAGTLANGPWALDLSQQEAGWAWSSLRILALGAGETCTFGTDEDEVLVLPLSGSCTVASGDQRHALTGRSGVFSGEVSDFVYAPPSSTLVVTSAAGGRFAVPGARAKARFPFRYQAAEGVPVELRGAGSCSRRVTNFCTPEVFEADRLIVCEVFTPAGNWSSYPPHKHDEERPGETALEEIYYFEVADGPGGAGVAYQRVYGTSDRPVDLLAEVRSGDVVVIPHGWHGPSMAAPGYDLYYLNVMAGPGRRAWLICDDPAHGWVRGTWVGQEVDPRVALAPGAVK
jgi:5-deoxy-glucuronate isomerase